MDSELDTGADRPAETDLAALGEAAGAGPMLRAARMAQRLELVQIAAETRIPLRHLESIEANAFESLPSRTYAIGFSRTYAKIVGLDEQMIVDLVRSELAGEDGRRMLSAPGLAPGDPSKLPSSGLAWAVGIAALILAVGLFAFYDSWFGAGADPAPIVAETKAPKAVPARKTPAANGTAPAGSAAATGGEVVLTATGAGVWLRITDGDGVRLIEKELASGERFVVPAAARDPRINTGRPDLLAITVGGKPVPPLADGPVVLSDAPIGAAALAQRPPAATAAASQAR